MSLWCARRDLKADHRLRPCQYIDRKTGFGAAFSRPLADPVAKSRNRKPCHFPRLLAWAKPSITVFIDHFLVITSDEMSDENSANITKVHQLANLVCGLSGRRRQNVAVDVHCSSNVFVA